MDNLVLLVPDGGQRVSDYEVVDFLQRPLPPLPPHAKDRNEVPLPPGTDYIKLSFTVIDRGGSGLHLSRSGQARVETFGLGLQLTELRA
jgi:hypothetical protein